MSNAINLLRKHRFSARFGDRDPVDFRQIDIIPPENVPYSESGCAVFYGALTKTFVKILQMTEPLDVEINFYSAAPTTPLISAVLTNVIPAKAQIKPIKLDITNTDLLMLTATMHYDTLMFHTENDALHKLARVAA